MQNLLVALIVAACAGYAVWVLMPSAWRRGLAQRVVGWPWPRLLATPLRRAAQAPTGCGCNGCDSANPAARSSHQPIRIHRQHKL